MPAGCRPVGGRVVARAAAKALEQEAVRALDATTFKDDAEFKPQRSQRFHCNKSTSPSLLAKPRRIDDYHRVGRMQHGQLQLNTRTMRVGEG
jgi:hypothetical protein